MATAGAGEEAVQVVRVGGRWVVELAASDGRRQRFDCASEEIARRMEKSLRRAGGPRR